MFCRNVIVESLGVWLVSSLGPNAAELSIQQLTISHFSIQQLGVPLVGGSAQRSIQQLIISHVIIQQLGHHCHSARGDSGTGQRRQQPCEPWRRPPSRQQKQVEGSRRSGKSKFKMDVGKIYRLMFDPDDDRREVDASEIAMKGKVFEALV